MAEFEDIIEQTTSDKRKLKLPPYIQDYFNVLGFTDKSNSATTVVGCTLNALTEAVNQRERLPKFLIVIMDDDILKDLDVFTYDIQKAITEVTTWFVKQIGVILH